MVTADCSSISLSISCHIGSIFILFVQLEFSMHTPSSFAAADVMNVSFGSGGIPLTIAVSSSKVNCYVCI